MNHEIRIYGEIGTKGKQVSGSRFARQVEALGLTDQDSLTVRISSSGGSVVEGLSIFHTLKDLECKVITKIDSLAASIASLIFMAGEERHAPRTSMLMVHNPSAGAHGNAVQLREAAEALDKWGEISVEAYSSRSGLDSEKVKALLSKDTWLSATEAKALGLVTHITNEEPVVMALDLSMFSNPPAEALELATVAKETKEVQAMAGEKQTQPSGIDPQKLTQFTEQFGAENAVAWIGLDYSEALQNHCENLTQKLDEVTQSVSGKDEEISTLKAQLEAIKPGEAEAIDKGATPETPPGEEKVTSMAGLVKIK